MTLQTDTRNPIGKLDFDTEDRNLPPQHYRYAKNGRSGTSDKDGDGAVENIRGNVLRNPSYQNRGFVIGTAPDVKNNAVIYFVYQAGNVAITFEDAEVTNDTPPTIIIGTPSEAIPVGTTLSIVQGLNTFVGIVFSVVGDTYVLIPVSGLPLVGITVDSITRVNSVNRIERYFDSTGIFENLTNPQLMGDVLNFSNTSRIHNPRVIESTFGQLLAWTDGVNAPRLMNIDKMKQGGEYYNTASDSQYIDLAKQPPLVTPEVEFLTSVTPPTNYFTNYFYQFRYRYIFDDGQISSMGDISDVALPDGDFTLTQHYGIRVSVDSGPSTVRYVQIMVREGNGVGTGDENPEWYIFKTVNKAEESWGDNTIEDVDFFNNEERSTVSRIDSDVNFYQVPQLAGSLEVVNNSQIVLANVTEGYDNVPSTATVEEAEPIFGMMSCTQVSGQIVVPNIIDNSRVLHDVYLASYISGSGGQNISSALDTSTWVNFYNSIIAYFNSILPATSALIQDTGDEAIIGVGLTFDFLQFSYNYTASSPIVTRGIKSNSVLPIGIIYYDNFLRSTGVNVLPTYNQAEIFQWYNDPTTFDVGEYTLVHYVPRITIANTTTAPAYFTKFKIAVKESDIGTWMDTGYTIVSDKIRLTRAWSFSVGDRVRWNEINTSNGDVILRDYTILSYDTANNELDLGDIDPNPTPGYSVIGPFVEVYSPQTSSVWFETDRLYDVGDTTPIEISGNSYYTIIKASGNAGTSAALLASFRNEPIGYAYSLGGTTIADNRMTVSDIFTNYWWKGRINIETPNQKRLRIGTLLRWSGVLVNNTQVNNLNVFDSGNYNNEVNARFGDISGLRQIGYTLKIIQWANYNTCFLFRKQIQNADGSTQLVVTDNLIGTINPSEEEYGTKYPGSIITLGRYLYFFDSIKAKDIVDDGNGLNETALYMGKDGAPSSTMSRYFRAKSAVINADSNFDIITGVDFLYGDRYMSFVNYTTKNQETLYYNKDQNAWKYFMDMESRNADDEVQNIIDCYGWVGQSFFGFLQANTYQFNKLSSGGESVYSTLFQVEETDPLKPLVVETIGMIDPDKVKVFLNQNIHANKPISLVEITVPANTMYPNGMYTVLKAPNFAYREGVYYADLKRDMFTNGVPSTEQQRRQAIANGRPMRGHVCLVRITYESTEYVKLYSTGIGMIPSELS